MFIIFFKLNHSDIEKYSKLFTNGEKKKDHTSNRTIVQLVFTASGAHVTTGPEQNTLSDSGGSHAFRIDFL